MKQGIGARASEEQIDATWGTYFTNQSAKLSKLEVFASTNY